MIPLEALKNTVYNKFDKDADFDPSLQIFRHTHNSISSTTESDYPYMFYEFSTADNILALGDSIPVGTNVILTFHLFSLGGQPSSEIEGLIDDLTSKFYDNPVLDIEQYTDLQNNWKNPTTGILDKNITTEPETNNWHGMVRFSITVGR